MWKNSKECDSVQTSFVIITVCKKKKKKKPRRIYSDVWDNLSYSSAAVKLLASPSNINGKRPEPGFRSVEGSVGFIVMMTVIIISGSRVKALWQWGPTYGRITKSSAPLKNTRAL